MEQNKRDWERMETQAAGNKRDETVVEPQQT